MRILIVNDDEQKLLYTVLAELSGEAMRWARHQEPGSAMSQRITLFEDIEVTPECWDVDGACHSGRNSWQIVKVALSF